MDKLNFHKISGACGIASPLVALICIMLALFSYPNFSWSANALSDLGVGGGSALSFNSGLIAAGALSAVFGIGLFLLFERKIGKVGAFLFILDCLSLAGIGLFPENVRPMHMYFSVAFFVLLPLSLLLMVGTLVLMKQKDMAAFTLLMAIVAAGVWVYQFTIGFGTGVAIPEFISALAASAWSVRMGAGMLKNQVI